MEKIRIVIGEDHDAYADGEAARLSAEPDMEVVAVALNGKDLLEAVLEHKPDVVITDIQMPQMDGIEVTERVMAALPQTKVIALTMYDSDFYVIQMVEAGAAGYVEKEAGVGAVIPAVRAVHRGQVAYSATTTKKLIRLLAQSKVMQSTVVQLSPEERTLARALCREKTTPEIADMLGCSTSKVDKMRRRLQEKLRVSSPVGIVVYCIRHKIWMADEKCTGEEE